MGNWRQWTDALGQDAEVASRVALLRQIGRLPVSRYLSPPDDVLVWLVGHGSQPQTVDEVHGPCPDKDGDGQDGDGRQEDEGEAGRHGSDPHAGKAEDDHHDKQQPGQVEAHHPPGDRRAFDRISAPHTGGGAIAFFPPAGHLEIWDAGLDSLESWECVLSAGALSARCRGAGGHL